MGEILASSVRFKEHIAAFDRVYKDTLAGFDLTPVLIYLIDTAPAAALPFLAEQFDVLGFKGWRFADTEAKKRALLKKAIELHRYKGTPWAVEESLKIIGYENSQVVENLQGYKHDGQHLHNGTITYNSPGPFHFRVIIDAQQYGIININTQTEVIALIYEYKNQRSWLWDLSFGYHFADDLLFTDDAGYLLDEDGVTPLLQENGEYIMGDGNMLALTVFINFSESFGPIHNGEYLHDGTIHYSNDYGDSLIAEVV